MFRNSSILRGKNNNTVTVYFVNSIALGNCRLKTNRQWKNLEKKRFETNKVNTNRNKRKQRKRSRFILRNF